MMRGVSFPAAAATAGQNVVASRLTGKHAQKRALTLKRQSYKMKAAD